MMEALLIPDNLDCHRLASTVVATLENLTKGAFSEGIYHFITVCEVVMVYDEVISALIIIPMIIRGVIQGRQFLLALSTNIINRSTVQNLFPLIFREVLGLT
jgi:hypothetical protein